MVSKELSESATELNEILENMSPELVNKIPKKFIAYLKNIASKTYQFEYDKTKTLKEQNIKPKTKGLLALIYKDFLCDEQEKQEYINHVSKILNDIEQEKRERYNPDNIFKTHNQEQKIQENIIKNEIAMVEYRESIIKRFMNKIKKIFRIN